MFNPNVIPTLIPCWGRGRKGFSINCQNCMLLSFCIAVTSSQCTLHILMNNMLTLLIISKKSKPLLIAAAVAQMSQKPNAFAMQGRGRGPPCAGTWRSQPAPASHKHIVTDGVRPWERAGACAELV